MHAPQPSATGPRPRLVHAGTLRSRVRRDLRGDVPDPGLCLRELRAGRGALQGRGAGLSSIRATPTRPSRCSRSAWRRSKAPRPRARPRPAWRRSPPRCSAQLKAGDHVVAARALFGSCRYVVEDFLPRYGIASTLVDGTDLDAVEERGAAEHQGLLPRKPDQSDARGDRHRRRGEDRACGRRARSSSTTSSRRRCYQKPLELGADSVVYSATKHIDGQGRCLGGVVLGVRGVDRGQRARLYPPDRARRSRRSTPGCC